MKTKLTLMALLASASFAGTAALAGPAVVDGPGADPACFAPWDDSTKYFQW